MNKSISKIVLSVSLLITSFVPLLSIANDRPRYARFSSSKKLSVNDKGKIVNVSEAAFDSFANSVYNKVIRNFKDTVVSFEFNFKKKVVVFTMIDGQKKEVSILNPVSQKVFITSPSFVK